MSVTVKHEKKRANGAGHEAVFSETEGLMGCVPFWVLSGLKLKRVFLPVVRHEDAGGNAALLERRLERLARERGVGDGVHVARDDRGFGGNAADGLDVGVIHDEPAERLELRGAGVEDNHVGPKRGEGGRHFVAPHGVAGNPERLLLGRRGEEDAGCRTAGSFRAMAARRAAERHAAEIRPRIREESCAGETGTARGFHQHERHGRLPVFPRFQHLRRKGRAGKRPAQDHKARQRKPRLRHQERALLGGTLRRGADDRGRRGRIPRQLLLEKAEVKRRCQ